MIKWLALPWIYSLLEGRGIKGWKAILAIWLVLTVVIITVVLLAS